MTATATATRQPELLPIAETHELSDTDWDELTEGDRPMSILATLDAPIPRPPTHALVAAPTASDSQALMAVIARAASDPTFDVAKLERLLLVKKEWERDEARKAYHAAMAAFKKNPPIIVKDAHVHYVKKDQSVVDYRHASLGQIVRQITASLSEHDMSASWSTERREGRVFVTCSITHALGHSESVALDAPPDDSGGKNAIQAVASTVEYLRRYTLLCITGLAAEGMDDDGRGGTGDDYRQVEQRGTERTVARDDKQTASAFYPAADFEKNLPGWLKAINDGKTSPDGVIRKVETKAPLTDQQKARIRGQQH